MRQVHTCVALALWFALCSPSIAGSGPPEKVYQGFNSGNMHMDSRAKSESDFRAEFQKMQTLQNSPGLFNAVRLYTNIQGHPHPPSQPISAFQAAIDTNTSLLLGIWCSGTTNITLELDAMMEAIGKHGQALADLVIAISVGSEDLYRASKKGIEQDAGIGTGPATITGFIHDTRQRIKGTLLAGKPVGHVDTWLSWMNTSNAAVVDAVDFLGVDIYPFFERDPSVRDFIPGHLSNTIDNAVPLFDALYEVTRKSSKGKPVWVTETGWPYSNTGKPWGQAEASVANQKTYWDEIGCRKLFGRVSTFWYTLRDGNPGADQRFAVVADDLALGPRFDLKCPVGSGAPATRNVKGGGHAKVLE